MKLDHVKIKNYRSIKELTLDFSPQCRVLVGINESGKSNILSALNLLDKAVKSTKKDLREVLNGEKQANEAYVRFVFKLSKEEASEVCGIIKTKILSNHSDRDILNLDKIDLTLNNFCSAREILYKNDILTGNKFFLSWKLENARISNGWKKISSACPPEFVVKNGAETSTLRSYHLVDTLEFPDIPKEYLEDAKPEDISSIVDEAAKKIANEKIPEVLFWNYDEGKLLPPKINLNTFCSSPDTCIPLKRMFNLNGIWEIKQEVDSAKLGSSNTLRNLLRRIAEKTTKHFHKTWKEYDDIKFSLVIDGDYINATIEDTSNHYELSQRSDGFKRFITFLLLVSLRSETNLLSNNLILIDEPEIGLHPKGARYLRDELIKLSLQNYVVFSTHSIFMIDNQLTRRHLIVNKKYETTEATEISDSNIQDEEVIFKSLGYSMFSNLKEKNLLFEGWRDKRIFEVAMSSIPKEFTKIKDPLKNVGYCFAQGVKDLPFITPLFEAGERKCLILSDNDSMAISKQKEYQEAKGHGTWLRYCEIDNTVTAVTGEDFIKDTAFTKTLKEIQLKHALSSLPDLTEPKGKIYAIRQWLSQNKIPKEEIDTDIRSIKEQIFENLRNSEIVAVYYKYLSSVVLELEKLK